MNEKRGDLSILVLSCDKYNDVWPLFFECFFKYWQNCQYDIYLGANKKTFNHKKVASLLTGDDIDWSSSLRKIINQIDSKYIFITLEDLFFIEKVDSEKFKKYFDILKDKNFNYCHINNLTKPDYILDNGMGIYKKGAPYRINVLGIWKKDYLLKILINGESPWNFEIMGSYRSAYDDGIYCLPNNIFKTINAIEKGRWCSDKLKILQKLGFQFNINSREVLGGVSLLKSKMQIVIFKLVKLISWEKRLKIMNVLRRILISY